MISDLQLYMMPLKSRYISEIKILQMKITDEKVIFILVQHNKCSDRSIERFLSALLGNYI